MSAFNYAELAAAGFDAVKIEYSGSGDEGYINDIIPNPPLPEGMEMSSVLFGSIERAAYDLLQEHYGGWEINEGSSGEIAIDVKAGKCFVSHGWTVESVEHEDKELT